MKALDKNFVIISAIFSSVMAGIFIVSQTATARPTALPSGDNYPGKVLYNDTRPETKSGALTVSNTLNADTIDVSSNFTPGSLCLSGNCRSVWPDLTQPNWNLQQVVNRSGTVYNQTIRVGSIRMKSPNTQNYYYSRWPTYNHDNAWGAYVYTNPCPWDKIMRWIDWGSATWQSWRCYETILWPYQN